uniref:Replication factor A C-terminal domain-containing protein n=1 Tax=Ananas comosus var. bracteatus TaxID=296719 RepID=A0A6V7Q9E0_ANACO|nr:unnamed protein product [Ananas comosus var. bracteatus]
MVLSEISTQSTISLTDDFLKVSQRKTLAEIQECQQVNKCKYLIHIYRFNIFYSLILNTEYISSFQPCICVTLATVLSVETDRGWYYNSYKKCSKKVIPNGTGFYFQLRVIDESGSASLILFDREVVQFLQNTAAQLHQQVLLMGDMSQAPKKLDEFLGKIILFKIRIKDNNINHPKPVYAVNKLSNDKTLIDEFLKKSILIEVIGNSKFKYDATIQESNSVTCDNEEADITSLLTTLQKSRSLQSPNTLTSLKRKNSSIAADDFTQEEHQMSSNKQKIFIKKEKD